MGGSIWAEAFGGHYVGGSFWAEVVGRKCLGRIVWEGNILAELFGRNYVEGSMFSDGRPTAGHRKAQVPKRNYFGQPSDGRTPQGARTEKYLFRAAVRRPDAARRRSRAVVISDGRTPQGPRQ